MSADHCGSCAEAESTGFVPVSARLRCDEMRQRARRESDADVLADDVNLLLDELSRTQDRLRRTSEALAHMVDHHGFAHVDCGPRSRRQHCALSPWCEAANGHDNDCATATTRVLSAEATARRYGDAR